MDINATLLGQFITFAILVWVTMKYVWPNVLLTLQEREKKVAAGLEAAARSKRELEMAEHKVMAMINEAKQQATYILEQANLHSSQLVEEAKSQAKLEGQRLIDLAQSEIGREVAQAKDALRLQVATLAVAGAEKIIRRQIDASAHNDLLTEVVAGL